MAVIRLLLENYVMLFELAGLWLLLRVSAHTSPRMKRLTRMVILLLAVESLAYQIELWTRSFETLSPLRPLLTALKYSLFPIILILLTQITLNQSFRRDRTVLFMLPALLAIPVYFTSQWTHLVCWFDETNHFHGGPLTWLPYVLFALYSVAFLIWNFNYFRKYSRMNRLVTLFIVVGAMFGAFAFLLMNVTDDYTPLLTSAILLYYLCIYIHLARIDPLTTLLNRQSYYQDLKLYDDRITAVVSVDMNDLKTINDTQGHEAGDIALQAISLCLWEHCGPGATVYRVGGDEFMILYLNTDSDGLFRAVEEMRAAMAKTDYVCAFGSAVRVGRSPVAAAIRESDAKMYEEKAKLKKKSRQ